MAKKTNTSTQSTQLPPYLENAYKGILKGGAKAAKEPYQQYTGSRTAGFTPQQQQGFNLIGQMQGMGLPYVNAAANAIGGVQGLDWNQLLGGTVDYGGLGSASSGVAGGLNWNSVPRSTVNPGAVNQAAQGVTGNYDWGSVPWDTVDWSGINAGAGAVMPTVDKYNAATLSQYMDPYLSGVIDPTMQRMQQEDAKQISNLKGSGIAMGLSPALGDRMGLAASDLAGQQALARNQVLGGLYSQGFQNAQQQLSNQQQLQLQGGTSDQARLLQAAQLRQQGRQADADRLLQSTSTQAQLGQQDASRLMEAQQLLQSGRQEDAARALQTLTTRGQLSAADQDRLMEAQQLMQSGRQEDANRILQSLTQQQQGGLAAAQGLAGLGQQAQDMTAQGIDYLMNSGQMQQQLGQKQLDQTYADWQAKTNYPKSQVDWLANLIYGSPGAAGATTTTEQPAPSILSQLLGLGTAGLGLAKSWGLGGAARGGRIRRDVGGGIPQLDVSQFQVDDYGWGVPQPGVNVRPRSNGVYEGDWYLNALPNLRPKEVGYERKEVPLPKYLRKTFAGIGRAANPGGDNGEDEISPAGRPIIRRWPDGTIKSVGGKPVKRAVGGLIPGTPEYDAEVRRLLGGEEPPPPAAEAASDLAAGDVPPPTPPSPTGGLGPRGGFFANKNLPLIYAGLGIAGGESPFPLQNIGSGALQGLQAAQSLYEKEMGLDANPTIDDSGPTIRVWYPSERRWEDTGIPTARWEAATTTKSDGTEKERLMEGKYGPGWRSNPEALKEFEGLLKTPTTSVTTNVDASGGKKFSEGLAEQGLEIVKEANAASSRAQDLELVANMAQNPDVYTGAVGETIDSLKRFAGTVLGLQVEGVPEGEIIRQAQAQAVGRLRTLLPGPMSDGDRAFLLQATPGLSNSTEGIMLASELARMQADSMTRKKQKLMQLMRAAERDPEGSSTDALIQFQEWMDLPENRVFTPETLAAAQARASERAGAQHAPTAGTQKVWEKYNVPMPGAAP